MVALAGVEVRRAEDLDVAKVLDGVGDGGRSQADVLVGFEGERHVLHEKVQVGVAGVEDHDAVLDPVGDALDGAERVAQAVQRLQHRHVQVQVGAAATPQDGGAHRVRPVRQRVPAVVEPALGVHLPQRRVAQVLRQVLAHHLHVGQTAQHLAVQRAQTLPPVDASKRFTFR